METSKQRDDDTIVADQRSRIRELLPQITQQVRQALDEAGIGLEVFLIVPTNGNAVATVGTVCDPADEEWDRISAIVAEVVRTTVGLDRVRCREVTCAATHDHLSPAEFNPADRAVPIPIPTPMESVAR